MRRVYHKPKPIDPKKKNLVNHFIKAPVVFLINEVGENLGVMEISKALTMALEVGLDLVEVNPKATPPVVKIVDFGQFKYQKEKEIQRQKVKQKKVEIKGVRLSARISQHDFDFRIDQAKKFLARGDKLRVEIMLKGREKQHPEKAGEVIEKFIEVLKKSEDLNIEIEQGLTKQGGKFNILMFNKQ
ncbi:translation initiation factor IF-3 [Patescibacteria group bacterium]|nr:translation initiation factor IF-3 [Patescibacteria group bacterium]